MAHFVALDVLFTVDTTAFLNFRFTLFSTASNVSLQVDNIEPHCNRLPFGFNVGPNVALDITDVYGGISTTERAAQKCGIFQEHNGKWKVVEGLSTTSCEEACSYEERDEEQGTHVTLKCFPQYDTFTPSACKRYTGEDEHLGCACFREGCNVEFLLNRHPASRIAVLPSLPKVQEWDPDGEISDCLRTEQND